MSGRGSKSGLADRQFTAIARPQGDPGLDLTAPHVLVLEHRGTLISRELVFSEGEAETLVAQLQWALRSFATARDAGAGGGRSAAVGLQGPLADPLAPHGGRGRRGQHRAAAEAG